MTTIPIENQISEIMDEFDFKKVRSVMVHLDWHWASIDRPPDIDELREMGRKLLREVGVMECRSCIRTGGFWATKDALGLLGLQFVVSDWEASDESLEV